MRETIKVGGESVAITPAERGRLERGEVVLTPLSPSDGTGVAARALALVEAPPEKVWPVVRDAEHFKEFMPRTKSSYLVTEKPEGKIYALEIEMPFPIKNLVSQVLSVLEEGDDIWSRRWELVEGTYTRNNGEWVVATWEPGRSLLAYWVDASPKVMIPGALLRKAQTNSLPDVFERVRRRVRLQA